MLIRILLPHVSCSICRVGWCLQLNYTLGDLWKDTRELLELAHLWRAYMTNTHPLLRRDRAVAESPW